ncbi:MAG: helix-turn-helix transcriptional regulator [Thermodesulfobacteriota bacterium]|jgi:transcriptional regulator with XRE-family HTH domain|nr:MAG: helix-turn-helix transcriptional regulator [Thermodesulfobacteriota bacterium]
MSDIKAILGARIRKLRKERRLSQEALAEKANLHYTFIGEVERGEKNISLVSLEKLAKALEVTLIDLFDLPELKERPNDFKKKLTQEIKGFDDETAGALLKLIKTIKLAKHRK